MNNGKYFDTLAQSAFRIAKAFHSKSQAEQFDLLCKNVIDLSDDIKKLSQETKISGFGKHLDHPIPLAINTTKILMKQIARAKLLIPTVEQLIIEANELNENEITDLRLKNLNLIQNDLHQIVSIFGREFSKINPKIQNDKLLLLSNKTSNLMKKLIPVITKFKNSLQKRS